jgi:hypothetical protein
VGIPIIIHANSCGFGGIILRVCAVLILDKYGGGHVYIGVVIIAFVKK